MEKPRKLVFTFALVALAGLFIFLHGCGGGSASTGTLDTLSTLDSNTGIFPNVANVMK